MLTPKTVAVVGATETPNSVGRTLFENLLPLGENVYPVNLKRSAVLGVKAYPAVSDIPAKIDLAVIAVPANYVPLVVGECAALDTPGAVIISAGFREVGPAGMELEEKIQAVRGNLRLIGPNCLGVMVPHLGLNATFAKQMALSGNIAFVSQSGALGTSVLDWSLKEKVGFSAFLSIGSMLDVGWGDLIDYLADDFHTQSILLYMESIGDARSFLSAAREVALRKPIIVIKAGSTEAAVRAVVSHTGTLAGDDAVLDAAFRRIGVLRVRTIEELFGMAAVLGKQPRPRGPRLAIVTNAGGPAVLAVDQLGIEGGKLASLSPAARENLNALLPSHWSHNNPVDVLGDADTERYAKAVEIVSADPSNDGVLAVLTPQAMTDATAIAQGLQKFSRLPGKPILASWMGAGSVAEGEAILKTAGIPTFSYPDAAVRTFCSMWRYTETLRALYETPALSTAGKKSDFNPGLAMEMIQRVQAAGRTLLTEIESKEILAAYGIPTVKTVVALDPEEAVAAANEIGWPVVLKLHSTVVTHKSDVGGIKLNLANGDAVRKAYAEIESAAAGIPGGFAGVVVESMIPAEGYELILGSSTDPQFGPVLLFGTGGQLVEILRDYALGLPPLNVTLARRLIEQTRIMSALRGTRGRKPVNLAELEHLLVQFSLLVAEQRWIKEIEINPLFVSATDMLALDARIVLHDHALGAENLPRLAIRPYPQEYISKCELPDGTSLTIRPIRPEDEPAMVQFHGTLSEETVRFRYFGIPKLESRVAHERLQRICFNDYDREIALVGIHKSPATKQEEIIAVGRLIKRHGVNQAEFAIVISDNFQRRALGTYLLERLVEVGRQEGVDTIFGQILPENHAMIQVSRKVGFTINFDPLGEVMRAELRLRR